MYAAFKRWLFLKALAELKKKKSSGRKNQNNPMSNIYILYEYSAGEDETAIQKMISLLQKQGKKVSTLSFISTLDKNAEQQDNKYILKDIGVNQIPNNPAVQEFISSPSDVLIVVCHHFFDHLRYITFAHDALLKIGIHFPKGESYFDLLIDISPELPYQKMIDSIFLSLQTLSKT